MGRWEMGGEEGRRGEGGPVVHPPDRELAEVDLTKTALHSLHHRSTLLL